MRTTKNWIDHSLLTLEQCWKWVDCILLKLEIRFRYYSLEKKFTQSRHKGVYLILRKCANYQEIGRPYIVEVGTKIGYRPYNGKMGILYTVIVGNCFKSYFHKKSTFCAKKLLNWFIDLIARSSWRLFIACVVYHNFFYNNTNTFSKCSKQLKI